MRFDLSFAHTTLSLWVLCAATLASSGLAFASAYVFGDIQRLRHSRLLRRVCGSIAFLLSAAVPFVLVRMALPLLVPELAGTRHVSFCFGDPHANVLIGVVLPLLRSWAV